MDKDKFVSRRNVIIAAGSVAAVGALAATSARQLAGAGAAGPNAAAPKAGTPVSLATGSYEDWLAQVGAAFAIAGGGALRLAGVRALESSGARPRSLRSRAFVAMFDPAGGQTLAGDLIYTTSCAGSAAFPIFLAASPNPRTPARMLAVFN